MSGHHCHATGCKVQVPPEMFMCRKHWFKLPVVFRREIYKTYRNGQCDDWEVSKEYCDAAIAAVKYIAAREHKDPDIKVYEMLRPE